MNKILVFLRGFSLCRKRGQECAVLFTIFVSAAIFADEIGIDIKPGVGLTIEVNTSIEIDAIANHGNALAAKNILISDYSKVEDTGHSPRFGRFNMCGTYGNSPMDFAFWADIGFRRLAVTQYWKLTNPRGGWRKLNRTKQENIFCRSASAIFPPYTDSPHQGAVYNLSVIHHLYLQRENKSTLNSDQRFLLFATGISRVSAQSVSYPPQRTGKYEQKAGKQSEPKRTPSKHPIKVRLFAALMLLFPCVGFAIWAGDALYKDRTGLCAARIICALLCGLSAFSLLVFTRAWGW